MIAGLGQTQANLLNQALERAKDATEDITTLAPKHDR